MNRKQARDAVRLKYGFTANVVNVSCQDRNQRFGVVYYAPGGAMDNPMVGCLGYGDSYQSAIAHADKNPVAVSLSEQWKKTQEDYQKFRVDPLGYKKSKVEQIFGVPSEDETAKETNNG